MSKHLHIMAQEGAIAETVLLPGDPLRAEFIAKTFLQESVRYNTVRGMYGFTGKYRGKTVSVQGTGMGIPSISIYINELLQFYGAKNLIRIGSCGSIRNDIHLRDIILAMSACSTSSTNQRRFGLDYAPTAHFELLKKAYDYGTHAGMPVKPGTILTSDLFYDDTGTDIHKLSAHGVLAIEMETAELYTIAAKYGAKALALLTVSDHILTGEVTTPEEREKTFTNMMEIALELA